MSKTFVVYGGRVISRHDGDIHYVSARRVAELWGLNLSQCYLIDEDDINARSGIRLRDAEVYHPDPTGRYSHTEEAP